MGFYKRRGMKKGPLPTRYVFLLTLVFFIFSTLGGLFLVNTGIEPALMSYAESETRRIASLVINEAVDQEIANEKDLNKIIETIKVENGKPQLNFNTEIITRVLSETTKAVQHNLKEAEKGNLSLLEDMKTEATKATIEEENDGIIFMVPLGQATNNALLGNLGPKIPVKFQAIGNVRSNVEHRVVPFGINNAYLEILIHFQVNVEIIIPFATNETTVIQEIPVAMRMIQGEVPQFYNNGGAALPSIELPVGD